MNLNVSVADSRQTSRATTFLQSDTLLKRLSLAYRHAYESFGVTEGSVWSDIFKKQSDLHNALITEKLSTLRELLSDPAQTYLYFGVDDIFIERVKEITSSPAIQADIAGFAHRNLSGISQALGAATSDGPPLPPDAILEALDRVTRVPIKFPNPFSGEFGIATARGIASYRAIHAFYQAHRLLQVAAKNAPKLVEIGAGTGRTCYFAILFGVRSYTIVDLPMTLMGQALFLASTLGETKICLPGEARSADHQVFLITPDEFEESGSYDAALNVDSMTEMSLSQARGYLDAIRRQAGLLLSINHEENSFRLSDLERAAQRGVAPMRTGYYEEIFDFKRPSHFPLRIHFVVFCRRLLRRLKTISQGRTTTTHSATSVG
jgi:hypothetical protein